MEKANEASKGLLWLMNPSITTYALNLEAPANLSELEGAMTPDLVSELFRLLAPLGSFALVTGILAYQSPKLVKEIFAGIKELILTLKESKREKAKRGFEKRSRARLSPSKRAHLKRRKRHSAVTRVYTT
jgi:hypothetical protein